MTRRALPPGFPAAAAATVGPWLVATALIALGPIRGPILASIAVGAAAALSLPALAWALRRRPPSGRPAPVPVAGPEPEVAVTPRWKTSGSGALTRSGLYDAPSDPGLSGDPMRSSEYSLTDMVNRLDPRSLCWIESSPAEQRFLGWSLEELRTKSFLEIVHPDDVLRAREALRSAAARGEVHGVVFRVRTATGRGRAVELSAGARYGDGPGVSHLRCHLTDVTAKLRAEQELRQRTRELTELNARLVATNRELEELKERYRDLYQNAPAMYFSLGADGRFLDCNDTMLQTLGYARHDLVGRPYETLLVPELLASLPGRLDEFRREGFIETESRWFKADGGTIDVWVRATAVRGPDGGVLRSRSVAQDVTARKRLEAELQEKNDRLARTIDELSRRNREMDEFTYVVSHDLQEPLRTLNAFSDFLARDYGDRLADEGQEFLRYIVSASRRMRGLIHDLLRLSRAGRVTGEFDAVDLDDVAAVIRSDLAELLRERGAEFRVAGPLPTVWGDRDRVGQLLTNLVTNGLKYNNDPRPFVELGAAGLAPAPGGFVTISVRDNGIGIDPQHHNRIFQLFRRLHTPEEYEGNGAGLAICRKIAQAHGGKVWVESEPNRGSTFFVTLPGPPAEPANPGGPAPTDSSDQHPRARP